MNTTRRSGIGAGVVVNKAARVGVAHAKTGGVFMSGFFAGLFRGEAAYEAEEAVAAPAPKAAPRRRTRK